jgi:hypothetical protein
MNWNSEVGISLFLALSAGTLSLSQAWVLGHVTERWPRYLVAWLGSSVVLAWAGGKVLDVGSGQGSVRHEMRVALFALALVIAAAALWSGAYWGGTQAARSKDFVGRMRAVAGPHFAVVFVGSSVGLLVLIVIGLSHIH